MSEPYFGWAVEAVEGLHWLADIDEWAVVNPRERLSRRDPRVIDVAHVRWPTTTAVTAIDLCVAEVAVRYCGEPFWSERMPPLAEVRRGCRGQAHQQPVIGSTLSRATASIRCCGEGTRPFGPSLPCKNGCYRPGTDSVQARS
jgi:hypothetical protein